MIKFKLNNAPLVAKKIDTSLSLKEVREALKEKIPQDSLFTCSDGTEIEVDDEEGFTIIDIAETEGKFTVVYLISKVGKVENPQKKISDSQSTNISESQKLEGNDSYTKKESINENPKWLNDDTIESNSSRQSDRNDFDNSLFRNIPKEYDKPKENILNENKNIMQNMPNKNQKKKNLNISQKVSTNEGKAPPLPNFKEKSKAPPLPNYKEKEKIFDKDLEEISYLNSKIEEKDLHKYKCIEKNGNIKIYLYPSCKFTDSEEIKALTFMVVGETGCGKTTLLNSFVNSLLGIEMTDDFRFKIISEEFNRSQAYSQTTEVKYYNIRSLGGYPPVKIIDTPGYGDTRGIQRDKEITAQIKTLFKEKISTLNAICFVTKSSNNRLTHSQRYILSSILDLFGEDVKEIFVFMLTFCDGGKPNIIEPLQDKNCPFSKIISSLKDKNWYYKFNNSAIFEESREDEFTQMFWKLGMRNFVEFKKKLKTLPRKSLVLSRKVLDERKFIEDKVQILSQKLRVGLNKIEEIKGIIKMVCSLKGDLNDSKNFTKTIKVPKVKKIPKDPNYYATTCIICTKTCHRNCILIDEDKKGCAAMDSNGYCEYCPKKCWWEQHKNRDYILEDIMEDKEITLEDLKKRYYDSKNELSVKKQLFDGAKSELIDLNIECLETQQDITKSINILHKIALNKSVFESAEEHIDLLIEVEMSEHKSGWQERIRALKLLKEEKKMLREVYQGTNEQLHQIKYFVENEINKYIDLDIDNIEQDKNTNCIII